jgi:hypothetical protein
MSALPATAPADPDRARLLTARQATVRTEAKLHFAAPNGASNARDGALDDTPGSPCCPRSFSASTTPYVFVALEGGLTRDEETLLDDGKEDLVRRYRISSRETMSDVTIAAVQEIMGRSVATYHSQIMFGPTRSFEIVLLGPRPTNAGPTRAGARRRARSW